MANLSTLTISGSNQYINITDHASAPSPTANKLYANSTSLYWEDTDLAAGGGDAMDKVKSQGPSTDGSLTTTGLANTSVLMASGANTAVNILFNQGTTIAGAYNAIIHVGGDCQMPGIAITSDGTNGSQTFNDLALNDATITAQRDTHHDSGGSVSLRMAGAGFGSGTDTAYNALAINFDGSGDYLQIPTGDYLGFNQTEDFTLDMFLYPTTLGSDDGIFTTNDNNSSAYGVVFHVNNTDKLEFRICEDGPTRIQTIGSIATNVWQHVAVERHNGVTRIYINGTPQTLDLVGEDNGLYALTPDGTGLSGDYGDNATGVSSVGAVLGRYYINSADNFYYVGYMDNFRYTKGYARFKGNDFSQQLSILARTITNNRSGEFTVRGNALYVGAGDDVSLADTGFVNRTGEDTTGDGLISVVIDSPQTVNSTAFMVPVIFKNTSDVQLTLNYNMWASVRANTATGSAASSRMTYYGNRGIFAGGYTPSPASYKNIIDYITIDTVAETATDFGDLNNSVISPGAVSSGTRGVFGGGEAAPANINVVDFITIASTGNASDFGDLNNAAGYVSADSDGNRGFFAGGQTPTVRLDAIDFISISVAANATDFGELTVTRSQLSATSNGSRGVITSGKNPSPATVYNIIDYITIGTLGDATDFGDGISLKNYHTTISDGSRAVTAGGESPTAAIDEIEYFNMATTGNASDFNGEITSARRFVGGVSNGNRGVISSGNSPTALVDTMDYFPIGVVGTDATDFGELSVARGYVAGTSGD